MSTFAVPIVRIRSIEPIEGADAIEVAGIGGYKSVVPKGKYYVGQLVGYIPEDAIVPQQVLEHLGLVGRLVGPDKNRVKAIRLRGVVSQGIVFDLYGDCPHKTEGADVAEYYGITKHKPIIPASMAGEVFNAGRHLTVRFDLENIKKYPDAFSVGEKVYITEKLHGTFCGIGIVPQIDRTPDMIDGEFVVFSKGIADNGLAFRDTARNRETNLYVRTLIELNIFDAIRQGYRTYSPTDVNGNAVPVFFLGEVFGAGVQDLTYQQTKPTFRLFAIATGYGDSLTYVNAESLESIAKLFDIPLVPYIARDVPFSHDMINQLTTGRTTIGGDHIREGVVVVPAHERYDESIRGRLALKSINEGYLLRNNKHATEYQ